MADWNEVKDYLQGHDGEWNWWDVPSAAIGAGEYLYDHTGEGAATPEKEAVPEEKKPSLLNDAVRKVLGLDGKPGVTDNAATIAMWVGITAIVIGGIYVIATFKPIART